MTDGQPQSATTTFRPATAGAVGPNIGCTELTRIPAIAIRRSTGITGDLTDKMSNTSAEVPAAKISSRIPAETGTGVETMMTSDVLHASATVTTGYAACSGSRTTSVI